MATIAVQELPRNGGTLDDIVFTAATAGGDEFANTGREILLVKALASWTIEDVQVEGVPSGDSGRDGSSLMLPASLSDMCVAGPFKPRNWNAAGITQITYPNGAPASTLEIAVLRVTTG